MTLIDRLRLMVLADTAVLRGRDPVPVCRAAVSGGATLVQLRAKDESPREAAAIARVLVAALPVPVIVNDRVDVALVAAAAGAHLGQDDVPLDALRLQVPGGFLLGISVGSDREADRARHWPADYWSIGPCYATGNKADAGPLLGAAGFAALARLAPAGVPVIGIGGITAGNAAPLVAAGAAGVAVIGAVLGAGDPAAAARALRAAVDGPSRSP